MKLEASKVAEEGIDYSADAIATVPMSITDYIISYQRREA